MKHDPVGMLTLHTGVGHNNQALVDEALKFQVPLFQSTGDQFPEVQRIMMLTWGTDRSNLL